jgi:hypothetical protein
LGWKGTSAVLLVGYILKVTNYFIKCGGKRKNIHSNLEHNITNIILVDASEGLNGSRAEAYAKGDIRLDVICLIFA